MPYLEEENPTPISIGSISRSRVVYVRKSLSKRAKRRLKCMCIFLVVFAVLCLLFTFIGVPIIFMNSLTLQRMFMFTNWGLPNEESHFKKYELKPGLRNFYVSVNDLKSSSVVSLGAWHLLPHIFQEVVITEQNFDFDHALKYSNLSVLLYFHGTGEDRSSSLSYADSSKNELSEDAVVNDCVQLYEWLSTKTLAPIIIWGHSLGTALASRSVAILESKPNISQPIGLVLEAPFTKMSDELYVHPYGKIFAWLPWFEATVIKPLQQNGFIFDNSKHVSSIDCPVMILNSEDDSIVPYRFGRELYEIAKNRSVGNTSLYYQFAYSLGYDHNFIYLDPFLPYFINYFWYICSEWNLNGTLFFSN